MLKKIYLSIFLLMLLTNCTSPGTALLGPAFTGATTKSVAQASLSFGTNQIVRKIHEISQDSKKQVRKIVKKVEDFDISSKNKVLFHFYK